MPLTKRLTLCALFSLLALSPALARAARPPLRPFSGCGVLSVQPVPDLLPSRQVVYAEPGLQRIAEFKIAELPALPGDVQEQRLAVTGTRGSWLRIAYDDAGREGWIESPRSWEYRSWPEYLPGRTVRVLPGMKKGFYQVKGEPRETGDDRATLSRDQQVRVLQVEEDWALLEAPSGWFRWRDPDGRLTVIP